MNKFTFNKKESLLIPNSGMYKPFKDKNGNELSGDNLIKSLVNVIKAYEKANKPIPIPDQKFVAWLKQFGKMLNEGVSSEEIMNRTLVKG